MSFNSSASPLSDIVTVLLTGHADEAAIERARQHANLHAHIANLDEQNLIAIIEAGRKFNE